VASTTSYAGLHPMFSSFLNWFSFLPGHRYQLCSQGTPTGQCLGNYLLFLVTLKISCCITVMKGGLLIVLSPFLHDVNAAIVKFQQQVTDPKAVVLPTYNSVHDLVLAPFPRRPLLSDAQDVLGSLLLRSYCFMMDRSLLQASLMISSRCQNSNFS
jgi:hypothetical protein